MIFADAGGMGEALAQRLTAAGGEALLVARSSGEPFQRTDNVVRMDPHREDHFERLAPLLNASGVDPAIVHLWSLDAGEGTGLQTDAAEIMRGVERSCGSALRIVQRLERRDARLWFITRGVHSVNASGGPTSISQAPLGGWVASLRCERPELCPVLVDLDTGNGDPVADLWSALSDEVEDRVAFRDGRRYVQRLEPGPGPAPNAASHAAAVRSDAAYLITGGLGALGLATARWLASRGAGHIVLTSRSAPSESASQAIRDLESRGVSVRVVLGDVARIDDVRRIMETIGGMPALAGVVHAAGTLDDGVIERQSWARYEKVMAPKVQGAWNLHLATSAAPLDFFIQFSSVASVFGSEGQTSYAAANAFLDGLADLRRAAGLPAVSINWGPWSGSGMAASMSERDRQRLARIGFDPIVEERASAVLDLALEQATAQIVAAHVRWPDYLERFDGQVPPLYEKVGSSAPASTLKPARASAVKGDLQLEIERLPMKRRRQAVFERIGSEAVRVLGLSAPSALDPRRPLHELGLDSLMAIELRNTLGRAIDRKLPATLLFKAPSIEALTDAVMEELGAADAELTPAAASETSEIDRLSDEEVADGLAAELEALARKGWAD